MACGKSLWDFRACFFSESSGTKLAFFVLHHTIALQSSIVSLLK